MLLSMPGCFTFFRGVTLASSVVGVLLLLGCGKRQSQADVAARDQIMIVGNGAEPSDLDPHTITGIPERDIVMTMFEGLTRADPVTLEALPGVAESWDVSPDGLVYTFHLRPNVKWSDGTPLTAHDFLASYRRILAPELASDNADNLYFVVNAEEFHNGRLKDFGQVGFRVPDDRTLEIRLRNPTPFLPKTMAFRSWFPVPLHVIEKFGDPYRPGNRWTRA